MITMTTHDFAVRLSELRNHKGVSARDMSLSLGQNPGYINSIENGRAYPSMEQFICICDYLGITPVDFFITIYGQGKYAQLIVELEKLRDPQYAAVLRLVREFNRK